MKSLMRMGLLLRLMPILALLALAVPAPVLAALSNDNFADATVIAGLPFSDTADIGSATTENGEPQFCSFAPRTIWYKFTPASDTALVADMSGSSFFDTNLRVYKAVGTGFGGLNFVGCNSFGGSVTFRAQAGVTYYLQAGNVFGGGGTMRTNLQQAPVPTPSFFFNPFDPSVYDTIQFTDTTFDPAQIISARAWDFGDGGTATGTNCCPTHRYASDGDYTVTLTFTTLDGRTASTTRPVHVSTHDVAITRFAAPESAHAGQTRKLSVAVSSKQSGETVQVQLYKSIPGFQSYQLVGTLTQTVPARSIKDTTDFFFSYTFTGDDATIGKVTLKAVATIVGARDALPADNEAIALPTKVSG